jgi:hypothetical protein
MTDTEVDFFKDTQFEDFEVSGRLFRFPILYYDFSRITASFPAPVAQVASLLPSDKLAPVELKPKTTMVNFVAYEYRKMEGVQPYNEFGVVIRTVHKETNLPGSYLTHLPVTTEEARWAGVEIYGFPKFLADISFEDMENVCRSQVSMNGKDIVSVEVKKMETQLVSNEFYTFTELDDRIARTLIQVQGYLGTGNDEHGASVQLGDHPISKEIQALGFDSKPLGYTFSPKMRCKLHKPNEFLPM